MKSLFTGLFILLTPFASMASEPPIAKLSSTKKTSSISSGDSRASLPSQTSAEERSFTSHLTVNARTRDWGKINIQRATGSNFNTSFIASSVTIAVLPRIELGTMPIFYSQAQQKLNYNLKANFWRSKQWDFSLGYSQLDMTASSGDEAAPKEYLFRTTATQLIANYYPTFTRGSAAFSYTVAESAVVNDPLLYSYTRAVADEVALDLSYPIKDRVDLTIGLGYLRGSGFTAYEDMQFGTGSTVAFYRPKKFFSKPAIGFHWVPRGDYWQILVGSSIL